MKIFTIGYEKKEIRQFIDILKGNRIELLIDIRAVPHSRNKFYTKKNLESELRDSGIEYLLKKELGSEKNIRDKVKSDGDYDYFFAEYENSLRNKIPILNELASLARSKTICLLCYEEDFNHCHRRAVADALARLDVEFEIIHL